MMTTHCSEEELQVLAGEQLNPNSVVQAHIETCASCQEQLAAYRLVIGAIKEQPAPAFDFDLESAVLQKLQPVKPAAIKNNYYQYISGLLVAIVVATTLYIFRQNFLNLSAGISTFFLAISAISCIAIIGFKVASIYRQYAIQIKKLNFSE